MSDSTFADSLPQALLEVRTRPLFTMRLTVSEMLPVGQTPTADRRVGLVTGGRFVGERLSATSWAAAATGRACGPTES